VHPYARHMSHGLTAPSGHFNAAILAPRARPSNVSVKQVSVSFRSIQQLRQILCKATLTMKYDCYE
jgi:hypothetical protein